MRRVVFGSVLIVSLIATLFLRGSRQPIPSPLNQLLHHFDLTPTEYIHRPNGLERLDFSETNMSFIQVRDNWHDTVLAVGDRSPTWFEKTSGGMFVVIQKPDGGLVGTQWDVVGGWWKPYICKTATGDFCGLGFKRVGGSWVMRQPEMRKPLPAH